MTPDDLMFKPGLMKGQRILITGGGTGLGKVMAEALPDAGRRGLHLRPPRRGAGGDRQGADGRATAARWSPIACDIRVPEAIDEMMDRSGPTAAR